MKLFYVYASRTFYSRSWFRITSLPLPQFKLLTLLIWGSGANHCTTITPFFPNLVPVASLTSVALQFHLCTIYCFTVLRFLFAVLTHHSKTNRFIRTISQRYKRHQLSGAKSWKYFKGNFRVRIDCWRTLAGLIMLNTRLVDCMYKMNIIVCIETKKTHLRLILQLRGVCVADRCRCSSLF